MKKTDIIEAKENTVSPETLQTYFKDAYMRERERFNSMFGTLEYNPVYEEQVYADAKEEQQVTPADTVPVSKLRRTKGTLAVFVVLTVAFLGAAAYFGAKYFGLI